MYEGVVIEQEKELSKKRVWYLYVCVCVCVCCMSH